MVDFKALLAKVKETGEDMTKAQAFTEAEPYPEGTHRARFVGYIEIGKQKAKYQGKDKIENQVVLIFELSGPRIKPREDGQPNLMVLRAMNKSLSEKAGFFKVFQRLNYAGKATHIAELLGEGYLVKLHHRKYKANDGTERTAVEMRKKGEPYDIMAPRVEDVDTGEWKPISVEAPKAPIRCFLWDYADKAQWDSIFIEGTWEERKNDKGEVTKPARSKNVYQNSIKLATNFNGSPIHALLAAGGQAIDIPDAESGLDNDGPHDDDDATPSGSTAKPAAVPEGAAADDALAGVV
jgi:hypothetical protein